MEEPKITLVAREDSYEVTFEVDGRKITRTAKRESPGIMHGEKGDWYKDLKKLFKNDDLINDLGNALEELDGAAFSSSQAIMHFGEIYSRLDDLRKKKD